MSVWNELISALLQYGKARCDEVAHRARNVGVLVGLCVVATVLTVWGLGLLVAALIIGLAPHLGTAWAAVIAAGAVFLLAAVLALVAMLRRK